MATTNTTNISGYSYDKPQLGCAHDYLLPVIDRVLAGLSFKEKRVFDLGCGNGSVGNWMRGNGWQVTGVDPSTSGIEVAKREFPDCKFEVGSCYDPLVDSYGQYPLVVSLEVVEHVYAPRDYAKCVYNLLEPGGYALVSTPYHGYLKNLALALTGKMDSHFTALWDHGHIKFWSVQTLTALFSEAGLSIQKIHRVGRIPQLAKTMMFVIKK